MTKVLVVSEVECWQTRARDTSDEWDAGDSAGRVSNVYVKIADDKDSYYYSGDSLTKDFESEVKPGDIVYAVVADYESGGTFGRDGGHAAILDVFTDKTDADALSQRALDKRGEENYRFTWRGKEYYRSWEGYFEDLQSLDIWECVIRGGKAAPPSDGGSGIGYKRGQ